MGKNADNNPSVRQTQKEDSSYNRGRGRDSEDTGKTSQETADRERNVGIDEEHSRSEKGNRGSERR